MDELEEEECEVNAVEKADVKMDAESECKDGDGVLVGGEAECVWGVCKWVKEKNSRSLPSFFFRLARQPA